MFIVTNSNSTPIIGLKTSTDLNIIKRIDKVKRQNRLPDHLQEFTDCFGEMGSFKKKHHIYYDQNIQPTVNPPRRVPYTLEGKLKKELHRMVDLGIITPVHEPTQWVSNIVCVEKADGSLRVCIDPRDLNKAIRRTQRKLPTTEEILAKLSEGKVFTKLDFSSAYWQIPLDEESSKLLTFNTPFGRFRFLRMAFGIKSASDICQQYVEEMIEGIEYTLNDQDDIILWSSNEEKLIQVKKKS